MLFIRPAIRSAGRRLERLRCRTERKSRSIAPWIAAAIGGSRVGTRDSRSTIDWAKPRSSRSSTLAATSARSSLSDHRRGLRVLGLEEAGERGDRGVVQPLPDRADLAAAAAVDQPLDLVLVVEHRGEQLARGLGAAGDLGAGGQQLEELDDHRVEHVLADLAEAADRPGEALHVGLGRGRAGSPHAELGADGGQDHRRLLDRASASARGAAPAAAASRGLSWPGRAGSRLVGHGA